MSAKTGGTASPHQLDQDARALLSMIRRHRGLTRTQMTAMTGWARVTVTSRLEQLLENGILVGDEMTAGGRGRPAARYRVDANRARFLVADVGAQGMRLARVDLEGRVEAALNRKVAIGSGPHQVLDVARDGFRELSKTDKPVWGVAMGLPGPVEFREGRVVSPPIMTGWDGVPVRDILAGWFDTPVLIDNDANAMAVGEQTVAFPGTGDLLVVKVGTGVGAGIISGGRVLRGTSGAAGDIGHTWAEPPSGTEVPDCRCGKRSCLEAYVGGWAIARQLSRELDREVDVDAVVDLLSISDPAAVRAVRDAGIILGSSLATAVSLLNPSAIVLGGQVAAAAGDHLLAGVRERIYTRSLPLAIRDLPIEVSKLWPDAGVYGLAHGIADVVLGDTDAAMAGSATG